MFFFINNYAEINILLSGFLVFFPYKKILEVE